MEPKFKVGERVQATDASNIIGKVINVQTVYLYNIQDEEDYETYTRQENQLKHAKLSTEDAWLETALMVGREVHTQQYLSFGVLNELTSREIRHRAYQILGGNGVKVTDEVKARVRSLIERAKQHA